MTSWHQDTTSCQWFSYLASALDRRSAPRLVGLCLGAVLARGRRTVTSGIRAADLSRQYQPCSTTVAAAGKQADHSAARLVQEVVKPWVADQARITRGRDDTPTPRYGPYVQGAGIDHNPAPGPAGAPPLYGPIGVVLGLLARHPAWGVIVRPLRARRQVPAKDLPGIHPKHRPQFRTKLAMGIERLRLARSWLRYLGQPRWVVVAGAQAQAPFLKPALALGMTVVRRRRRDAALGTVPGPQWAGRRGRPRIQGEGRIEWAQRAGQGRGWEVGVFERQGQRAKKRYQTFEARWRPAGGRIRVVLVDEPGGGVAFCGTDVSTSVAEILATVAARFALESTFRDGQEVVGAGQQPVRLVWAHSGAFHIGLGTSTRTEAWAWGRAGDEWVDRRESPGDDPNRRPSHPDKRRAWRRQWWAQEIRAVLRPGVTEQEIQAVAQRLLSLAA